MLHEQRRKIEYKIVFSTLTFFVLFALAILTEKFKLPKDVNINCIILFILLITIFIYFIIKSLVSIHDANKVNKKFAENAENSIINEIKKDNIEFKDVQNAGHIYAETLSAQITIIIVFAISLIFIIILKYLL